MVVLHGGKWRPLSLRDCLAAVHKRVIILFSFSSLPTKTVGSVFVSSLYAGVGLASSNCDLKSMSTISLFGS